MLHNKMYGTIIYTVTLGNVGTVVILGVPGAGQRVKSSDLTNCPGVSKDQ